MIFIVHIIAAEDESADNTTSSAPFSSAEMLMLNETTERPNSAEEIDSQRRWPSGVWNARQEEKESWWQRMENFVYSAFFRGLPARDH